MTIPLTTLPVPVVQAPMAGGPSTPALAVAVARAGGLGMLAAGYKSTEAMAGEVREIAAHTDRFGVNLFVPEQDPSDPAALAAYARALAPVAAELGVPAPEPGAYVDDEYPAKLDHLTAHPVPLVSFTFGLPTADDVARLRNAGSAVVLNATSPDEVTAAARLRPDAIVVQGSEAGGHRATHGQAGQPEEITTAALLDAARELTDLPLVAAGGIAGRDDAAALLARGAAAVQVGTLFLAAREAGTKPAHRAALLDGAHTVTVVTRAFSGRAARALRNRFTDRMAAHQVTGYPQVHYMTAPLRAASSGDPEGLNLWAGTGAAACRETTAAEVVELFRGL
ncbi:NAD(P)H-dependent flavin oxidoreductase [Kocuria rhizophila]|uniref:NAD(P)H-dependent flavin oxidoreductase n=1 Tax=Kocuria rhizophila TaxID=72000 RepID=UPI0021A73426|nr:nitronate monooxygenase [Kocuria rhizophila]MCT1455963.1 nitronate monooxygenase [Kocuria rhizophila]MCT2248909.1 nitronate monooxygenase [Kocuria rhizophila]